MSALSIATCVTSRAVAYVARQIFLPINSVPTLRTITTGASTKVLFDHVNIQGSGRVGIYFDDYLADSTRKDSTVSKSIMSEIYLEHSSCNNRILNNCIVNNGHESFGKGKREGLAIDSSANNRIDGDRFESNGCSIGPIIAR